MNCEICNREFKNTSGLNQHIKACKKLLLLKDTVIDLYVNKNYSYHEIRKELSIQSKEIKLLLGDKKRDFISARELGLKKYPDCKKHTKESKQKLREARLKFMKDNPDKTAWRLTNLSYPEKIFLDRITELDWIDKYNIEREKSVFPYYIDFAFKDKMIAFEIDGSQHLLPERIESDIKKDNLLKSLGWKVIRVNEGEIKNNLNNIIIKLKDLL